MTSACLIEDPPPYTKPKQTPPRLDLRQAVPFVDQIITRSVGALVQFNVPVVSEDAGDDLVALLYLNYTGVNNVELGRTQIAPGTLDQLGRDISIDWTVDNRIEPGCQRLTLLVTHFLNVSFDSEKGLVEDEADVAMAVWWANINPTPGSAGTLVDCPQASQGQ